MEKKKSLYQPYDPREEAMERIEKARVEYIEQEMKKINERNGKPPSFYDLSYIGKMKQIELEARKIFPSCR
jgi:hypothetical protein